MRTEYENDSKELLELERETLLFLYKASELFITTKRKDYAGKDFHAAKRNLTNTFWSRIDEIDQIISD